MSDAAGDSETPPGATPSESTPSNEPSPQPTKPRYPVRRQSQLFFLTLLIAVFVVTWIIFQPFLIFMITGVLVAVIALPIDKLWERFLPNRLAAVGTMLTLLLIVMVPLVAVGFALVGEAQNFAEALEDGTIEDALDDVIATVFPDQTPEERNATLAKAWDDLQPRLQKWVTGFITTLAGGVLEFLVGLVVVLFVVYYVLTDGERLMAWMQRAAPLPPRQVNALLAEAGGGVKAVFYGQILTSIIQGVLGGIGFAIAGLPGVVLWAAVMAILSLLPVVGAFLVWLPAALYLFAIGDLWQAIFLVIWGIVVVGQIDNFVRPKLIGDRANIHPLFVLVGVLGGVAAYGFIGLFLGPLMVGIAVSMLRVWESDYLDYELRGGD